MTSLTLTVPEAAKLAGVGDQTIRRLVKAGDLPAYVSPSRRNIQISMYNVLTYFGLCPVEVAERIVADHLRLSRSSDEQPLQRLNGQQTVAKRGHQGHAGQSLSRKSAGRGKALRQGQQPLSPSSTNPSCHSDASDREAKARRRSVRQGVAEALERGGHV